MKRKSLVLLVSTVLILIPIIIGCRAIDEKALSFADQATEKYLDAINKQD